MSLRVTCVCIWLTEAGKVDQKPTTKRQLTTSISETETKDKKDKKDDEVSVR